MIIKSALSSKAQASTVFKALTSNGSINRYEAEKLGVCHLAPRIHYLKSLGFVFSYKDETVSDQYHIQHKGIRRYWIDWSKTPNELKKFVGGEE